ncbi:6795_t:CDS:2 [Paraglomus brasilianum]|uniref:6795_t:CDS:1 n=1 Tax=Paraglomus brasilianum TaxID=144538 RepID=A0A9N8VCX3_9GLOM|nr:6795_t:CDS:2 [Paraglomus brasilianum]
MGFDSSSQIIEHSFFDGEQGIFTARRGETILVASIWKSMIMSQMESTAEFCADRFDSKTGTAELERKDWSESLKPEGDLFVDRRTNLQQRSIIERRLPIKARRKRRPKMTDLECRIIQVEVQRLKNIEWKIPATTYKGLDEEEQYLKTSYIQATLEEISIILLSGGAPPVEIGEESDAGVCPATEKKKDIRSNEVGRGCYRGICTVRRTVQYLLPRALNSASALIARILSSPSGLKKRLAIELDGYWRYIVQITCIEHSTLVISDGISLDEIRLSDISSNWWYPEAQLLVPQSIKRATLGKLKPRRLLWGYPEQPQSIRGSL